MKTRTRDYKEFAPGEYYHIYNRGNGKRDIFIDSEDFIFFLDRLRENLFPEFVLSKLAKIKKRGGGEVLPRRQILPENSFDLVSYCLMPNHFHLIVKQKKEIPVTQLLLKVSTGYSKYFNKKYNKAGHLFQERFRSIKIDSDEYLLWLSAYIHLNPKTARLVKNVREYPWSSLGEYLEDRENKLVKADIIMDRFKNSKEYEKDSYF
jgi:putative transposase